VTPKHLFNIKPFKVIYCLIFSNFCVYLKLLMQMPSEITELAGGNHLRG